MNIYLIPICDDLANRIIKVAASSLEHAKDHLYSWLYNKYDWTTSDNLDDLRVELNEEGVCVGDFYDIEDFQ